MREHFVKLNKGLHDNSHLQSAWDKYGEENFEFKIITNCRLDDLILNEQHYINLFQSAHRAYGYNIDPVAGNLGKRLSPETKNKIRQKLIENPSGACKINRQKTHCTHGHPYSIENTVMCQGRRRCRICRYNESKKQELKKREIKNGRRISQN